MKEKIIIGLLISALALGGVGCSDKNASKESGETSVSQTQQAVTIVASTVVEYLKENAKVDATDFVEVDPGIIDNYYAGLGELSEEYTVLINGTGGRVDEIAVIKAKEGVNVSAVKEAVEARIEKQKKRFVDYQPGEMPKLEGAAIKTYGDTIILLISEDENGVAIIEEAVK